MMPLIGESMDFNSICLEQQFKVSLEQYFYFTIMLLKDNMNRLSVVVFDLSMQVN